VNTFGDVGDIYGDVFAAHAISDSYSGSHNYRPDTDPFLGLKPHHVFPGLVYHPDARDAIADYLRNRLRGRHCDARKYLKPPTSPVAAVTPLPL